jgi:O-6-methylguanine DNA methyltransferase
VKTSVWFPHAIGNVRLDFDGDVLIGLNLDDRVDQVVPASGLFRTVADKVTAYLDGLATSIDVKYRLDGTPFRKDVWNTLAKVPYGTTISYGELAKVAGHPGACRAVGGAMATNPIPLVIPCHRVINADGSIGHFTGGTELKRKLLSIEGVHL